MYFTLKLFEILLRKKLKNYSQTIINLLNIPFCTFQLKFSINLSTSNITIETTELTADLSLTT